MHLRILRSHRKGKTYEYAQLVESYRRDDGMPLHRVVAHLGALSPTEIDNLRAALEASRRGKRVHAGRSAQSAPLAPPRILANLRYLDVALLLDLWRQFGLGELVDELMPAGQSDVTPSSILAALAIERCVAPGSTLYATQWFPTSALPELCGVAPSSFNNTRLHRTLDELDRATPALMSRLPRLYQQQRGQRPFVSLFLDVTDTWFVGRGPELAERAKTKEGIVTRKVGIVLLSNEHGYPLRWEVLAGKCADGPAMMNLLRQVAGLPWVGAAPVVFDRAMGKTAYVGELARMPLHFLTALAVTEFDAYAAGIPHSTLAALAPASDAPKDQQRVVDEAAHLVGGAGFDRVEDDLWVSDFGIVEHALDERGTSEPAAAGTPAAAMKLCRQIGQWLGEGRFSSEAAAGRELGMGKGLTQKYRQLGRLAEDLQREIVDGKADGHALSELLSVARIDDPDRQRQAFRRLLDLPPPRQRRRLAAEVDAGEKETAASFKVRVVVYFNPERFVEQRLSARRQIEDIRAFAGELNAQLGQPRSRRSRDSIVAAVDRKLRSRDLLGAFKLKLDAKTIAGRTHYQVALVLDEADWARRRRYDGFTVLVAHSALDRPAADLARLYREKDTVEKDFQTIKSFVELRPVWHHTDGKVRAHVTVCMLALLLERALRQRLGPGHTAKAALETLGTCHLNQYGGSSVAYALTQPTVEQRRILRRLRCETLVDEDELVARLTPRSIG